MLCTATTIEQMRKLGDRYIYEPKLDGARAIIQVTGTAKIYSRDGKDITHRWPEIVEAIDKAVRDSPDMPTRFTLDGEIVICDNRGRPEFNKLQQRLLLDNKLRIKILSKQMPAQFVAFDMPHIDSDYMTRRRELDTFYYEYLQQDAMIWDRPPVTISTWAHELAAIESLVNAMDMEGIVAKRKDSLYQQGARNSDWLKWKQQQTADCVVVGYTEGEGKRAGMFGALVLAQFDDRGHMRYVGKVGTGFNDAELKRLSDRFDKEYTGTQYYGTTPGGEQYLTVAPFTVEVKFMERSKDGILRQPVYVGERVDKAPADCRMCLA